MNHTVLDAAEAYVFERVKEVVAKEVTEKLLEEFNELIQEKLNEVLPKIIFQLYSEEDIEKRYCILGGNGVCYQPKQTGANFPKLRGVLGEGWLVSFTCPWGLLFVK